MRKLSHRHICAGVAVAVLALMAPAAFAAAAPAGFIAGMTRAMLGQG